MATYPQQPQADPELVEVFDTQQESEALVVQGLLASAGIESIVSALDAPQDVLPGVGGVIVRVRPEQADEALRLIEDYRAQGSSAADEAELESESSGDRPVEP